VHRGEGLDGVALALVDQRLVVAGDLTVELVGVPAAGTADIAQVSGRL
jgi:hypothetical protein